MNQAVNMLRNTRASNLVFLFALPVLIYFVATSRNYGAALTAVLGIEDQALRLLLSFFLFIALGCLGIFGSFLLIKSLRPDQEVTEVSIHALLHCKCF